MAHQKPNRNTGGRDVGRSWAAWLRSVCRLALRALLLSLCALGLGLGFSYWTADTYRPTLDGNLYAILATRDSLFMVLSTEQDNVLVRTDHSGHILNYANTADNQAFRDLEALGGTVYAIMDNSQGNGLRQLLVSLSLEDALMRKTELADLTGLSNAPAGITWRELYLPPAGEASPALRLAGIDAQGQGWLLRWGLETGYAEFERILEGETLFALKYVADGHYVWINRDRQAGQYIGGVWQRDILSGQAETPLHISTCAERCFISDSVSGDIFEVLPNGTANRFRSGGDPVGSTGHRFQQLETYTAYAVEDGAIRIAGMCADGDGGMIAGEAIHIRELSNGALWPAMLWQHGWRAALVAWCALAVLAAAVRCVFRSPRLAARLLVCELAVTVVLLGAGTAAQYASLMEKIIGEAEQKLRMTSGSIAALLSTESSMDGNELAQTLEQLRERTDSGLSGHMWDYSVSVIWATEYGPVIGFDGSVPEGYLVEDVKTRGYLANVSEVLRRGEPALRFSQSKTGKDFLYLQQFTQGGRNGCVVVSQPESDIVTECKSFFMSMLPIFAACPLLFLGLAAVTLSLLRPLDEIQRGLEEFYTGGSGNQMALDGMPHTELYEVGRVFNQLSIQTRTQMNDLQAINGAYQRLVPDCMLDMLQKQNVTELSAGDHAAVRGALVFLCPKESSAELERIDRLARAAAEHIARHNGIPVDCGESLAALFQDLDQAQACARASLDACEADGLAVTAAVLEEVVELGVFGGERLLFVHAVCAHMDRRQAVLALLCGFGAVLVLSGSGVQNGRGLRLLGWDGEREFYEVLDCRPSGWQSMWRETAGLWDEALSLYRNRQFAQAMRRFARVLRAIPGDAAARWYLFRCELLRDGGGPNPDTGLLYDWEEQGHG